MSAAARSAARYFPDFCFGTSPRSCSSNAVAWSSFWPMLDRSARVTWAQQSHTHTRARGVNPELQANATTPSFPGGPHQPTHDGIPKQGLHHSESSWPESEPPAPQNPAGSAVGGIGGVRALLPPPPPSQPATPAGGPGGCRTFAGRRDRLAASAASASCKTWMKALPSDASPMSSYSSAAAANAGEALPLPFFLGLACAQGAQQAMPMQRWWVSCAVQVGGSGGWGSQKAGRCGWFNTQQPHTHHLFRRHGERRLGHAGFGCRSNRSDLCAQLRGRRERWRCLARLLGRGCVADAGGGLANAFAELRRDGGRGGGRENLVNGKRATPFRKFRRDLRMPGNTRQALMYQARLTRFGKSHLQYVQQ